jgi:hypothetical protein
MDVNSKKDSVNNKDYFEAKIDRDTVNSVVDGLKTLLREDMHDYIPEDPF